ncbi:hypothetical protein ACNUDN_19775 [Mycobacterium sp. smrl_JER01]|uniref:hypothetical protein n=1 Tax=Mycobacterium sp. smrl_JER01 TaxID=3402633 RepID=UPI003ABE9609
MKRTSQPRQTWLAAGIAAPVADGSGGFVTVLTQTGTVTATAPESVTVRSIDGFTQTWTVAAGGQGPVPGDSVLVRGTQDGVAATATELLDPQLARR